MMFSMAIGSFAMWLSIIIFCVIVFAFLIFMKNRMYQIYLASAGGAFFVFFSITVVMFSFGMSDREILNGYVEEARYYEQWTEYYYVTVCDSRDEKGDCTSEHLEKRTTYHPPYWEIGISVGATLSITQTQFKKYESEFGSVFQDILRFNQDSYGDGNAYFSKVPFGKIPASVYHMYDNYVLASQETILKNRLQDYSHFNSLILPYPSIQSTEYGSIKFIRTVNAGTNISSENLEKIQKLLDDELTTLGANSQINIITYFVNTKDQSFIHALDTAWMKGKKNDLIVVVGYVDNKIIWSNLITWTDNELFKVKLRDRIIQKGSLEKESDIVDFVNIIVSQIRMGGEDGYKRKPMADYEYLTNDISLSFEQNLVMVILSVVFSLIFIGVYLYNEYKNN